MQKEPVIESIQYSQPSSNQSPVIDFLNKELRPQAKFSIVQEYPSLFKDYPGGQSYVVKVGGKIASHVGTVVRELIHSHYRMKIGLIGSVATAPEFQKRGYASQLITRACNDLKKKGCSTVWLWAPLPEFYYSLGFYRAGLETDIRFTNQTLHAQLAQPLPFSVKKHSNQAWRLYQKHVSRVDRSLEEMQKICEIPKTNIYITEENNQLTSYIAINKGADFENYIHEWAGDINAVAQNIISVQQHIYKETSLTLISPHYYETAALKTKASVFWDGAVGLCRILDAGQLINTYVLYLKSLGMHSHFSREKLLLEVGNQKYTFRTEEEVLDLIFGCGAETKDSNPKLPFFLWGFDSI